MTTANPHNPADRAGPDADLDALAQRLRDSNEYAVLPFLRRRERYAGADGTPTARALFVDVETTGLDVATSRIIQLAIVPFEYGVETGKIYAVDQAESWLEDPGCAIPPHVVTLTGITDDDVQGQHIDDGRAIGLVRGANLVIAHNAAFDRPLLEQRLQVFSNKPWACSRNDVPWDAHGHRSGSLEFLLFKHGRAAMRPHRADADCLAGVHILATPFPTGELPMALLLASARTRSARIRAIGSPYESRELLKQRGYRWFAGGAGRPKCWFRDVPEADADAEYAWLEGEIYGRPMNRPPAELLDARTRYSAREPNG